MGKMLLNGTVVQFDEIGSLLRNLPEEQKSTLIIQSGRDVLHEQIVKVMDIAKEAGIDQIEFAIGAAEGERMQGGDTSEKARAFGKLLREMIEKEAKSLAKKLANATRKHFLAAVNAVAALKIKN